MLLPRYYVSISSIKVDRKWQDIGDSGHSKGSLSRNDPRSLDGRKQGGMTQSLSLAVTIACDTASTFPLPLFDSHYAKSHFREKWAREVIARLPSNRDFLSRWQTSGETRKGDFTYIILVIIASR